MKDAEHFATKEENRISKQYPGLFAKMNESSPASMAASSIPIGQYAQINRINSDTMLNDVAPIYFNHMWRKHRVIYQFDKTLTSSLLNQAAKMDEAEQLPSGLLKNLPYPCIAIESAPFTVEVPREDKKNFKIGFTGNFYLMYEQKGDTFDWNALNGLWELVDGRLVSFYIPVFENGTIKESIEALHKYLKSGVSEVEITRADAESQIAPFLFAIQIVLYLQAQNADIQNTTVTKKKKKSNKKSTTQSHAKPPKIVYVGFKVGKILRSYNESTKSKSTGTGTSKRPHSRRGHWHHFWTGAKNKPEERKLVLKWVAPTMVHGDQPNETTTVVKVQGTTLKQK